MSGQSEDPSATIRRMAWDAGRRMFFEHPFIGVGAGNFPNVWATEYTDPGEKPLWKNAHSLYYQLASEQGVVGIAVWGYLVLSIFWSNRKTRKLLCALESRSSPLYFLSYGVDLALLSVLVSGVLFRYCTIPSCLRWRLLRRQWTAWFAQVWVRQEIQAHVRYLWFRKPWRS